MTLVSSWALHHSQRMLPIAGRCRTLQLADTKWKPEYTRVLSPICIMPPKRFLAASCAHGGSPSQRFNSVGVSRYYFCDGGPSEGFSCLGLADFESCGEGGTCVEDVFLDPCGNGCWLRAFLAKYVEQLNVKHNPCVSRMYMQEWWSQSL